MHCTKCGSSLPPNTKFCTKCGALVAPAEPQNVCANCESAVPSGNKFCVKCGTPVQAGPQSVCVNCGSAVPSGNKFCVKCGTPVQSDQRTFGGVPQDDGPRNSFTCPKCGKELKEGASFCIKCGTAFVNGVPVFDAPEHKCPVCGAQVASDDAFCDSCGADLIAYAASGAPDQSHDPYADFKRPEPFDNDGPADGFEAPVQAAGAIAGVEATVSAGSAPYTDWDDEDDKTVIFKKPSAGKNNTPSSPVQASANKPDSGERKPVDRPVDRPAERPNDRPAQPQYQAQPARPQHQAQPQYHDNVQKAAKKADSPELYKPANGEKKKRKGLVVGLIIGALVLILGGLAAFVFTSNAYKTMTDLSNCEFESAVERYENNVKDSAIQSKLFGLLIKGQYKNTISDFTKGDLGYPDALEYFKTVIGFDALDDGIDKFKDAVEDRCKTLADEYAAGTADFNSVKLELSEIAKYEKELLETETSIAEDQLKAIEATEASKTAFENGEKAMESKEYAAAIAAYSSVSETSPLFADASAKLAEAKEEYKKSLLASIDSQIASNNYNEAMALLAEADAVFPNDADFDERSSSIASMQDRAQIDQVLALSREKQAAEDYLGALNVLSNAINTLGEVPELRSEYITCENKFVLQVQTKVNERLATDWEGAKTIAEDALNALPNNVALASLLQSVMLAKPTGGNSGGNSGGNGGGILLTTLNWYDSYRAEVGGYTDAHGSYYQNCLKLDDRWYENVFAYYNINRAYRTFTATITPCADGRQWREVHLQIVGDNTVLYETDVIFTSEPKQISLNVSGCSQLKFILTGDNENTGVDVLIANPMLIP